MLHHVTLQHVMSRHVTLLCYVLCFMCCDVLLKFSWYDNSGGFDPCYLLDVILSFVTFCHRLSGGFVVNVVLQEGLFVLENVRVL